MHVFLLSFAIILVSIAGLAVGVLVNRKPLVHRCGGAKCGDGVVCVCGRGGEQAP